jgi:hypothetical protein
LFLNLMFHNMNTLQLRQQWTINFWCFCRTHGKVTVILAKSICCDKLQPNSAGEMTSFSLLLNKELVSEPIVIGDCVVLSRKSLYNAHSTSLLVAEFCQQLRLFNRRLSMELKLLHSQERKFTHSNWSSL